MSDRIRRMLRWTPFALMAAISIWVAVGGWTPRRPFAVDLSVTSASLTYSLAKTKHYASTVLFFGLAVLGAGRRRPFGAFWAAMVLGVAWEVAESTAVHHTARVADLAPDLAAALACLGLLLTALRFPLRSEQEPRPDAPEVGVDSTG